jgi:RNA polymerase sigma-70 factor (ECF subfamily)
MALTRTRAVSALTDLQLVHGIQAGSGACFDELYSRHFHRVYNFAAQRVGNRADAEEVVQEVFAAVFCSVSAFRGDSQLLTWIFGIARNTVNNHLRRRRAEEERLSALEPESVQPTASLVVCTPEEQLTLRRCVEAIREKLESVSEWQLDIYRLRHEEDLPIDEIARRTHRTGDAVRSSLYRVKRILVEAVDSERGVGPSPAASRRDWSVA